MIKFLSLRDILDILIIAFLIYRILLLLMDTRAMQLVKGLLLLALVSVFARTLRFEALSWILGKFLGVMFIAIPIVFQPELRRMLEEIGKGSLWRRAISREKAQSLADEVLRALLYLQSQKIGALIVLQRSTGLKDVWQSAVKLDAEISQEVLVSIFWPGNPLHDGAVILDRERVIAASCFLPLSDNPDISRWLGTRHRAALGITEVSDAISLVVSEERGEVSFAIRGHLSRGLKENQLRQLLLHYFLSESEPTSLWEKIREAFASFRSGGVKDDEMDR